MWLGPGELIPAPLGLRFHLGEFDTDFGLKISIWPIIFGYFGAPAGIVFLPRGRELKNYSIKWIQARISRLDERNARTLGNIADEEVLQ